MPVATTVAAGAAVGVVSGAVAVTEGEALPAGSFDAHPEGLHLWLRLPPRRGRLEFVSRVRQQGLELVPSDAFTVEGAVPPDAVRVSLGAAPGLDRLRRALRRMAAVLQEDAPAPFLDVV